MILVILCLLITDISGQSGSRNVEEKELMKALGGNGRNKWESDDVIVIDMVNDRSMDVGTDIDSDEIIIFPFFSEEDGISLSQVPKEKHGHNWNFVEIDSVTDLLAMENPHQKKYHTQNFMMEPVSPIQTDLFKRGKSISNNWAVKKEVNKMSHPKSQRVIQKARIPRKIGNNLKFSADNESQTKFIAFPKSPKQDKYEEDSSENLTNIEELTNSELDLSNQSKILNITVNIENVRNKEEGKDPSKLYDKKPAAKGFKVFKPYPDSNVIEQENDKQINNKEKIAEFDRHIKKETLKTPTGFKLFKPSTTVQTVKQPEIMISPSTVSAQITKENKSVFIKIRQPPKLSGKNENILNHDALLASMAAKQVKSTQQNQRNMRKTPGNYLDKSNWKAIKSPSRPRSAHHRPGASLPRPGVPPPKSIGSHKREIVTSQKSYTTQPRPGATYPRPESTSPRLRVGLPRPRAPPPQPSALHSKPPPPSPDVLPPRRNSNFQRPNGAPPVNPSLISRPRIPRMNADIGQHLQGPAVKNPKKDQQKGHWPSFNFMNLIRDSRGLISQKARELRMNPHFNLNNILPSVSHSRNILLSPPPPTTAGPKYPHIHQNSQLPRLQ